MKKQQIKLLKVIRNQIEYLAKDFVPCFRVRSMTNFIRNNNNGNKKLMGAEIGVNVGYNAETMLSVLPIKKLHLIDSYVENNLYGDSDIRQKSALKQLKRFGNKVSFLFMDSKDAVDLIPNDLDFVYIDGNHNYEFVKQDIELYYPKIKAGGVFGGEDFSPRNLGVSKAVIEFVGKHDLKLLYGKGTDWWVVKNR